MPKKIKKKIPRCKTCSNWDRLDRTYGVCPWQNGHKVHFRDSCEAHNKPFELAGPHANTVSAPPLDLRPPLKTKERTIAQEGG